ncbi:bifunctional metallophosphatase/5'-nucleotidase [Candidatus Thorarchaeota archaeon]|nr:MAG: bifunctional metallophosphatase/5'-nucleotidase [Candidatus Thorarchaeota archaeon]
MNDSHAYIEPHSEFFFEGAEMVIREAGGYARIGSLVKSIRDEKAGNVLFLDNGDTIHGTYPAVQSQGEALVPILNEMTIDAMTLHWEFGYGPDQLKKIAGSLNFPLIACNAYDKDTENLSYSPYHVFELNRLKIGVIGIANRIVDITMPESFSKGVDLTTGLEELPVHIQNLRSEERVDLVVVLSHLGFPHANYIAENIDGIDIILSGHTHNRIQRPVIVNDTILIQSGYQGSYIGRLDVRVGNRQIRNFSHELIEIDDTIAEDQIVKEEVDKVMAPHKDLLGEVVGETNTPLARNGVLESTMDNFLLQGLIHASGAELAFSNGWRYGAPVRRGFVKVEDLWNIIPTNPPVSVCTISGGELFQMMEENLEATFSRDPFGQMGGYVKRCLGLNIYFKIENPNGRRIEDFYVGGKKLERSKKYNACFVTTQGIPEKYGTDREHLDVSAIEALRQYVSGSDQITANLRGSIVAV